MSLSDFLRRIPSDALRFPVLKVLFRKNKLHLSAFQSYHHSRFFIYKVNGVSLASDSLNWYISLAAFEKHCREISTYAYQPAPGDVIVDIGSGLGEEVIVYSRLVGEKGRVIAIEANPVVCEVLIDVVKLNGLSNVTVLNQALSETAGPISIVDDAESYLAGSMQRVKTQAASYEVPGMPLSALMKKEGLKHIDFLKVNIEGAERFLLDEAEPSIFDSLSHFAISCHDFRFRSEGHEFFRTKELITNFFSKAGFRTFHQQTGVEYVDDWVYGTHVATPKG